MIWVIGGTSETGVLLEYIRGRVNYIVTVATYSGSEVLNEKNVVVSRMTYDEMINFIKENNIDTVVDMSHPYAVEVTNNAKRACELEGVRYIRFVRKKTEIQNAVYVNSVEECCSFLSKVKGCVFFTTGIKTIKDFQSIRGENRFVYRVIPSLFSIQECVSNNVKMKDIAAVLGPFSKEFNMAMFKEYGAEYVVTKDSGKEGGTAEKIDACLELGITPIIIGRAEEDGIDDIEKLLEMIL
ncbi:precorrin-6x reductase [Fervidicella metallireducens AeB]|uniref:Precorrin-6x reductase n=1 Tax=Fervidicella metallireducens AeB TaxID=1403537 RepID=A0A017RXB6_9CLOT|nr:precorrin-6A reductase [Fervidicella metallireducens]EYE89231.1 precorrin-6x reductase [Fervidicella metallireducens AeB]